GSLSETSVWVTPKARKRLPTSSSRPLVPIVTYCAITARASSSESSSKLGSEVVSIALPHATATLTIAPRSRNSRIVSTQRFMHALATSDQPLVHIPPFGTGGPPRPPR